MSNSSAMTAATASGIPIISAKKRHARHASRQLPPVAPSTNSGTTKVQPKIASSRSGSVSNVG